MKININKKVIILIIILLAVSQVILTRKLDNLDEIWNYNFARNILEGNLPYKDFNIMQTPLLPIIVAGFLAVFGNQLIIMRILAIAMATAILFVVYKILELLKLNKYLIYLSIIGIYLLLFQYFTLDYNFMLLLILLIVMYIELKNMMKSQNILHNDFKSDFLPGILIGISILFNCTTGICISLICVLYKILLAKNKEEFRVAFKIILSRLLGVFIPVALLIIYLIMSNIFNDFVNYAISGIKTFTNYIPYTNLIINGSLVIKILAILIPISILIMYYKVIIKKVEKNEQKNLFIIFAYSVGSIGIGFPILDSIHFSIGAIPSIIGLIYIMWNFILKLNDSKKGKELILIFKEYIKTVVKISIPSVAIFSLVMTIAYLIDQRKFEEINHFKYISNRSVKESIYTIDNYILEKEAEGKKVYILDVSAVIYMIPLNKDYDMLNIEENDQIEKLKKIDDNCIVLINNKDDSKSWQIYEKARTYIADNWTKTGEIENFDIYQKGI